jgi:pyrimidine operon attenuation protein/uracil phosphoribosyltransferase
MRTSAMEKAVDERTGVPDHNLIFLDQVLMVGGGIRSARAMSWSARSASRARLAPFTTRNARTPGSQKSLQASVSSLSAPVDSCDNHPSR